MFSDALRQYRAVLPDSPITDAGAASVMASSPGQTRIAIDVRRIAWIRRLAGDYAFDYSKIADLYAGNPAVRDSWTEAMRHLPESQRELLKMRYFDDLTQAELSRRLGISQMEVCRRLRSDPVTAGVAVGADHRA